MNKLFLSVLIAVFTLPVYATSAEITEQEFLNECQSYAKDDEVTTENLQEYLKTCVEELKMAAKEDK